MKTIAKKITAILLMVAMVATFSACSGEKKQHEKHKDRLSIDEAVRIAEEFAYPDFSNLRDVVEDDFLSEKGETKDGSDYYIFIFTIKDGKHDEFLSSFVKYRGDGAKLPLSFKTKMPNSKIAEQFDPMAENVNGWTTAAFHGEDDSPSLHGYYFTEVLEDGTMKLYSFCFYEDISDIEASNDD